MVGSSLSGLAMGYLSRRAVVERGGNGYFYMEGLVGYI